jgi:membrane protein DedA with SNARE-associated domain
MGHYGKDWVKKRFGNLPAWINASDYFQRQAWMAIFFTRFLVTALAIPTNLIAGGSGYKFSHFMLYDALGETVWIVLYGGLGYLFGSQWELVNGFVSNFGGVMTGLVLLGIGIFLGLRWFANHSPAKVQVPEE